MNGLKAELRLESEAPEEYGAVVCVCVCVCVQIRVFIICLVVVVAVCSSVVTYLRERKTEKDRIGKRDRETMC